MKRKKVKKPIWCGPEEDGITQSLLSRFLCCRERFRLLVVEGLRPADQFNHRIEYGQMWHICEETYAGSTVPFSQQSAWSNALRIYAKHLCSKYQLAQEQIEKWYNVCKSQFPIYVDYWSKHSDEKKQTPLLQEQVFNVPYELPSRRVVKLRGKWDGVSLIGTGKNAGVYLDEHKTKGDVRDDQMKRQLQFDLQTMLYLVALHESRKKGIDFWKPEKEVLQVPIKGVRYNVIRRPLAGGKHSIRQHKPTKSNPQGESKEQFYARLARLIAEEPEHYFMRWRVEVTPADLERFKREFLNPILEQLCDWWGWISSPAGKANPFNDVHVHWRTPYGFWNVLAEGGSSDLDEYLATGSELGLERTTELFGELK